MKALSFKQPWAWAVLYAGKVVDNRKRKSGGYPPEARHRGLLAIHASANFSRPYHREAAQWISERTGLYVPGPTWVPSAYEPTCGKLGAPTKLVTGAIVGTCRVLGAVNPEGRLLDDFEDAEETRDLCEELLFGRAGDPGLTWHMPPSYGLILADVRALERPVPYKGRLGLFDVPDELLL